ncbi:hypothetical protein AMECASPLE_024004 [Ameca splendens]|uniref:Uncharacterized protein n=1 Tax=Ameca splendens TaxID=208324 RepID=A0ABV0YFB3_9TELE
MLQLKAQWDCQNTENIFYRTNFNKQKLQRYKFEFLFKFVIVCTFLSNIYQKAISDIESFAFPLSTVVRLKLKKTKCLKLFLLLQPEICSSHAAQTWLQLKTA